MDTYSFAVLLVYQTQVDLAVQVDGGEVFEGEHLEGEACRVGDTILVQLYCSVLFIRTPGLQGRMLQLLQNNIAANITPC